MLSFYYEILKDCVMKNTDRRHIVANVGFVNIALKC